MSYTVKNGQPNVASRGNAHLTIPHAENIVLETQQMYSDAPQATRRIGGGEGPSRGKGTILELAQEPFRCILHQHPVEHRCGPYTCQRSDPGRSNGVLLGYDLCDRAERFERS